MMIKESETKEFHPELKELALICADLALLEKSANEVIEAIIFTLNKKDGGTIFWRQHSKIDKCEDLYKWTCRLRTEPALSSKFWEKLNVVHCEGEEIPVLTTKKSWRTIRAPKPFGEDALRWSRGRTAIHYFMTDPEARKQKHPLSYENTVSPPSKLGRS